MVEGEKAKRLMVEWVEGWVIIEVGVKLLGRFKPQSIRSFKWSIAEENK